MNTFHHCLQCVKMCRIIINIWPLVKKKRKCGFLKCSLYHKPVNLSILYPQHVIWMVTYKKVAHYFKQNYWAQSVKVSLFLMGFRCCVVLVWKSPRDHKLDLNIAKKGKFPVKSCEALQGDSKYPPLVFCPTDPLLIHIGRWCHIYSSPYDESHVQLVYQWTSAQYPVLLSRLCVRGSERWWIVPGCLSWVRSCPRSPNNSLLYFLPSCFSSPPHRTSASSVLLLPLQLFVNPCSLCVTSPYPCSARRHRGTSARFPLCFPSRARAGGLGFGDIWIHLVGLPLCPANSFSSVLSLNWS